MQNGIVIGRLKPAAGSVAIRGVSSAAGQGENEKRKKKEKNRGIFFIYAAFA